MGTWADYGIMLSGGATGEVDVLCPQCSASRKKKSSKCLSVNVEKGTWLCQHCGWAGGLGVAAPPWRQPQYRVPPQLVSKLSASTQAWCAERGIPVAVLVRNRVTSASVYMPQVEEQRPVIVFAYLRGGELVNRKYRTRDKLFRMDTGAERILYGLDDIDAECVVIVEGEMDKLSVEVAGVTSCVSVPDGAPAPGAATYNQKFSFLDSAEPILKQVKKFILAVDSDAPGRMLEDELARRLGRERCWRVQWPAGCKDANDVLVKHGATDLRWFIDHADPCPIDGLFTALGEQDKVVLLRRNGLERGVSTGWRRLDQHYTVRPGEFTVVTGVPGAGKSNFVDALIVNLAREHGWAFGIFSPENQPIEDHMARMMEKYLEKPFSEGPTPRMTEEELRGALEWANDKLFWMLPGQESSWDIEWILARAKELVYRHGIRGLVIDPWNELEPQRKHPESETEYVSRVLRVVRQFARRNGIAVFMVVHPTKLYRDDEGKYPVPTLYDCAGSAHWRNKADNGLCVWRDFSSDDAAIKVYVQKIRFRQIGRIGHVELYYDKAVATYSEYAPAASADTRFGE